MKEEVKKQILKLISDAHKLIEDSNIEIQNYNEEESQMLRQKLLLADLATHLVQESLSQESINKLSLSNRLYSILTICNYFLPEYELDKIAKEIINKNLKV